MSPALTPETPLAAVTLVFLVETVTLFAFACTAETVPAPETEAPAAETVTEPTDAPLCTVRAAFSAITMLSTEPETTRSDFAVTVPTLPPETESEAAPFGLLTSTPLPAEQFLRLASVDAPRMTMRPVTFTPSSETLSPPSAMMRSPLTVTPESEAPSARTIRLPSTVWFAMLLESA